MTRVADTLVATLASAGVRQVFGVAGDSLNGVTDAIRGRRDIAWVHVRHEESAAFAAGALAQLTGELAVCAGSCGPGNLHLINGLYDAHRSRAPVLALAAQIPTAEIGREYFQETDPQALFHGCSYFQGLVARPEDLAPVLEQAVRTARGQRGVAVVVLPGDVGLARASGPGPRLDALVPAAAPTPSGADLDHLASLLNEARHVTILAGGGSAGARPELMEAAAHWCAPVVHTLRAKDALEFDNPFDVGMTGLIGFSSGYHAMMDADLVLLLGTDFPYRQFYPEKARIVQVDTDPAHLGRRTRVDLGIVGDVATTLRAVLPRVPAKTERRHLDRSLDHYRRSRAELDALATGTPGETPIHPQYVARLLDELAGPDAIFTCDVGLPTVWAARYLRMNGRRRLIGSFWHGSMANALSQAIGASYLEPARPVVSLSGDGGLAMLFGEVLSLKQLGRPVKVVVFDNGALGFVRWEQMAAGLLPSDVDLVNPDFAAVARDVGIWAARAERPDELRPMLVEALAQPGPALVDVVVSRQELAMPPTLERAQVEGFGLWLVKAVLSGRGDEVVDLAHVNLFR
ncbi:MAG TPA: ubiquinone-dependent pyruvate dehydrogenase [Thermoplasmata archaeon]|nr:ubiquinone-dependent pyruvate dehydrogenase [Thermoplasmata archaeon]